MKIDSWFEIWKKIFGSYLIFYFIFIIPYIGNLYSEEGMISNQKLNWTYFSSLEIFNLFDSLIVLQMINGLLIISCLFLIFNKKHKISCLTILLGIVLFYNRNNLTGDPSLPYIAWLLLFMFFIPNNTKEISYKEYNLAAIVFGFAYLVSGISKIVSPSWINGSVISKVLAGPITRDYFVYFVNIPEFYSLLGYLSIILEISAPLLLVHERFQKTGFILFISFHIINLIIFDLAQVSLAMIVIHLFLFKIVWIKNITPKIMKI